MFLKFLISRSSNLSKEEDADDTGGISRSTFSVADCIDVEGPSMPTGVSGDGVHGGQEEVSTAAEGVQLQLHPSGSWWIWD